MTPSKTQNAGSWKLLFPALAMGALVGGLTGQWLSCPDDTPALADNGGAPALRQAIRATDSTPPSLLRVDRTASRSGVPVGATPSEVPEDAIAWARTVPPELIGEAMEAALRIPQFNLRRRTVHELIRHWATYDPAAAIRFADALHGMGDASQLVLELVALWAVQDIHGAAYWVKAKPRDLYPVECAKRIAEATAGTHPEAALALLFDLDVAIHGCYGTYLKIFDRLGTLNPRRAAELALGLPPVRERIKLLEAVFNRWAQRDPEAAQVWIAQLASRAERQAALQALGSALTKLSPEHARTVVMQLPPGRRRRVAIAQLARAWAQQDIAAAVGWVQTLDDSDATAAAAAKELISAWLEWDRDSVKAWIESRPGLEDRIKGNYGGSIQSRWLEHLAERDPQAAFDYVLEQQGAGVSLSMPQSVINALPLSSLMNAAEVLPEDYHKHQLLSQIVTKWGEEDFVAALQWSFSLKPIARPRRWVLNAQATRMLREGKVSPEALLDMASRAPDEKLRAELNTCGISYLFSQHPDEAIARFRRLPTRDVLNMRTLLPILRNWIEHDPDSALAEIRRRFRERAPNEANAQFAIYIAYKWPQIAETELSRLPHESRRRRALINALWAQRRKEQSPEERRAWINGFEADELPPQLLLSLLPERFAADPDEAFRFVEKISDPVLQQTARQRLIATWAYEDPPGALEAVIALPDTPFKVESAANTFIRWLRKDAEAAEAWLLDLGGVPWRDGPVCAMVRQLLYGGDSERARGWAESIADANLRQLWLAAIDDARNQRQRELEAAEAWQSR